MAHIATTLHGLTFQKAVILLCCGQKKTSPSKTMSVKNSRNINDICTNFPKIWSQLKKSLGTKGWHEGSCMLRIHKY